MKSYFFSILGWMSFNFLLIGIILYDPYPNYLIDMLRILFPHSLEVGLTIVLALSTILSPILGPVGNFFMDYLIKKLDFKTLNPFINSLIACLVFLLFSLFLLELEGNYNDTNSILINLFFYSLLFSWFSLWLIGAPILMFINFLHKRKMKQIAKKGDN